MINAPYGSRINPYAAARPASAPAPAAHAAAPNAPAQAAAPTGAPTGAPAGGLSAAEQGLIDRYFPEAPGMALKLYGPGGTQRTAYPAAIGGRLDLRG